MHSSSPSERHVTKAIIQSFSEMLIEHIQNDVIIIGSGPSGLMCAHEVAKHGFKVLIIERNNYLGGGFWIGGFLMNPVTFREPSQKILDTIGCPYRKVDRGLYVADGPHACSKLIAAACDAGARVLNFTEFDDLIVRDDGRVGGVVVNWMPVSLLPKNVCCADPIALESKYVVDSTGHDASAANILYKRKLIREVKGFGAMWVEKSEDAVVEYTGMAYPGLLVTGMAVSTLYGLPRMGPTFGSMLLSGQKAGRLLVDVMKGKIKEDQMIPENVRKSKG